MKDKVTMFFIEWFIYGLLVGFPIISVQLFSFGFKGFLVGIPFLIFSMWLWSHINKLIEENKDE